MPSPKPLAFAVVSALAFAAAAQDRPTGPATRPVAVPASAVASRPAGAAGPSLGVTYSHEERHTPNFSLHVVTADLDDGSVSVGVARGGPDPDGDGKWTTTLLPVREVAERERFDVAVNGDFFEALQQKDVEGKNTGFVRGKWATPQGPAETDGVLWRAAPATRPALLVGDRRAAVADVDPRRPMPTWVRQAVGGNAVLVRDGKVLPQKNKDRHPRTVAGVTAGGARLILLVVDGRQPKLSIGMTYEELGAEMVRLGAADAVNLDGGGSTTLVVRDPRAAADADWELAKAPLVVANSPSDGRERSVADVLGIRVARPFGVTRKLWIDGLATRPATSAAATTSTETAATKTRDATSDRSPDRLPDGAPDGR